MMKGFCSLLKKDVGLMASGKFFLMSLGFLILYTLYVNFMPIPAEPLFRSMGKIRKCPVVSCVSI